MIYTIPTERNTHIVERKVFENPRQGIECMFVKLKTKEGIKIYPTLSKAKYARTNQLKAYKSGVAPNVYSNICKCFVGNLLQYDKQEVFKTACGNPLTYGYFFITEVANRCYGIRGNEAEKVSEALRKAGIFSGDMLRLGNLGRIKGRLVAIDFGKESTW